LPHKPRFIDGMREWLLTIDMLAQTHSANAGRGMMMIGSGDDHRIDLLVHFIEHLAVIVVLLCAGILLAPGIQRIVVDVAESDDVFRSNAVSVAGTLAARANDGDVHFLIR